MRRTLFLSVSDLRELLNQVGLPSFVSQLVEQIRADYLRWPEFHKRPRLADYSPAGVIELMPIADAERYAFKYVTGHPMNAAKGAPTIMGFGCLSEIETGWPLLISEMTLLTAIRTAATSAMVAKLLAKPGTARMAVIGNGAQSDFQVLAIHELLGLQAVHLFDKRPEATDRLMRNLGHVKGLNLIPFTNPHQAVKGCDVITTLTAVKKMASIVEPDMVEPGMHINAVGGDCPGKTEIHPEVLLRSSVFVEFAEQARIEGDIQQMTPDFPVTELYDVLIGNHPGRQSADEVTLFDSVGFSLEDYSTLVLTHRLAAELNIGQPIELVPPGAEIGDLYGYLIAEN